MEENQSSGVSLSAENLADLKKQLSSFCLSYNDQRFESVYDAKYSLQASVAEYMNFNALGDMDAQLQAQGINYKQISTPQPGIISYVTDSFEGVAPEEVTADSFDRSQYTRQVGRAGELIEAGRVEITHLPADKPHAQVYEGDVFTVRGKGRFNLTALPGKSRKDRPIIEFFQY